MRLPSSAQQQAAAGTVFEELLEAERTATSPFGGGGFGSEAAAGAAAEAAGAIDEDLFRFREKGAIAGTDRRREVEPRRRRGPAGGGRGGSGGGGGGGVTERSAVRVELATQLGVPATSTYEEVRRRQMIVLLHLLCGGDFSSYGGFGDVLLLCVSATCSTAVW